MRRSKVLSDTRRRVVGHREAHQIGAVFGVEPRKPRLEGLACGLQRFAHRQFLGHDGRLVGAADAKPGPGEQRQAGDVLPLEHDLAGLRPIAAGEDFEQAGLAGAVRPDDPKHLTGPQLEADVPQDLSPTKVERDVTAGEDAGSDGIIGKFRPAHHQGDGRSFDSAISSGQMILWAPSCT